MVPTEPPATGRVMVVTGPTSGIGFVVARELARRGHTVVLVARDARRVEATTAAIESATGSTRLFPVFGDLAEMAQVRRVAQEILGKHPQIHVLVNNAGAVFERRRLSSEGHERTWAVNVMAPFLLTTLLADRLRKSAPARVVNVSSAAHEGARLDLVDPEGARQYSGYRRYGQSKLALVMLTYEFARRLKESGVAVNALHPGFVRTRFGQNNGPVFATAVRVAASLFAVRPDTGARTPLYLASSDTLSGVTGRYFVRERPVPSSRASYDAESMARLWTLVAEATGVSPDVLPVPGGAPPPPAAQ